MGAHKAVFVKATLSGGKYGNQWLEEGKRLKYFLKSRNGVFKETYAENAAIIEHPEVPVYAFVRHDSDGPFRLAGVFRNAGAYIEKDESKWFELVVRFPSEATAAIDARELREAHERDVLRAQRSTAIERLRRLAAAPRAPATVTVVTKAFIRNPDVVAEVLERAAGIREACGNPAPFKRRTDGLPYLEVHHKVPLAVGGDDAVENAVALCPSCHRNEHYGSGRLALGRDMHWHMPRRHRNRERNAKRPRRTLRGRVASLNSTESLFGISGIGPPI